MKDDKEPWNVVCARYQAKLQTNNFFPYENKHSRNATVFEQTLEEFKKTDRILIPNKGVKNEHSN